MEQLKLYMVLLGSLPKGRNIEQHDIFFGIGTGVKSLAVYLENFWPEAENTLHIDCWREVTCIDSYKIEIVERMNDPGNDKIQLFFINLGGYKPNEFEEYHYKILSACESKSQAIKNAKQTAFFKHTGFKGAESHIDERYGIDVDDVHNIQDILPSFFKEKYSIKLFKTDEPLYDKLHMGYYKISSLKRDDFIVAHE